MYVCVYVFLCTHTHIYTCTFSGILTLVCSTNIKPQDIEYKEKKFTSYSCHITIAVKKVLTMRGEKQSKISFWDK